MSIQDFESYIYRFSKDDGYLESAITAGKANINAFWNFANESGIDDCITLQISNDLQIMVTYENGELADKYHKEKQELNDQDF